MERITANADVDVMFEITCNKCGKELEALTGYNARSRCSIIEVVPCERCMRDEYERGKDVGLEGDAE